jgi:nicotinamidase-related amidase
MTSEDQPTLLLIDIQNGLDDLQYYGGRRNNPGAEGNAAALLGFWRQQALPVVHVKHNSIHEASPLFKGKPGNNIKEEVKPLPHERLIEKQTSSAFINTDLQQYLQHHGIHTLIIAGLTTDHCVSATTRMAGDLGYKTYLVSDATATFDRLGPDGKKIAAEILQEAELACLHGEFTTVLDTASIMKMLGNP